MESELKIWRVASVQSSLRVKWNQKHAEIQQI